MTIEKLTDRQERELTDSIAGQAALCLIEELASKCDAQAAMIERVRAELGQADKCSSLGELVARMRQALSAAPERTGPDVCNCYLSNGAHRTDCPKWRTADESRASGFAKLTHAECIAALETAASWREKLERSLGVECRTRDEYAAQRDAANARVAELESEVAAVLQMADEESAAATARVGNAESEAAALRATCNSYEETCETLRNDLAGRLKEAAKLRKSAHSAADRLDRAEQRETVLDIASELRRL
jgi:hypothetical protein